MGAIVGFAGTLGFTGILCFDVAKLAGVVGFGGTGGRDCARTGSRDLGVSGGGEVRKGTQVSRRK